ncbi:unnamed protein product, partial [Brachionus calyciflorus]
ATSRDVRNAKKISKRKETEAEIFIGQNVITVDEKEAEEYRIWAISGQSNKSKRISYKSDVINRRRNEKKK